MDFNISSSADGPLMLAIVGGAGLLLSLIVNAIICSLLAGFFRAVPPEHRRLSPAAAWLLMIPLFALVWNFVVFPELSASCRAHYGSRGWPAAGDFGKNLGIWYAISSLCSWVPCIGPLFWPIALVVQVVFLLKINRCRDRILANGQETARQSQ